MLKTIRTQKKMTQPEVAKKANVSLRAYLYYEQGKRKPSVDIAFAIAEALNSDVVTLFKPSMHDCTTR